MCLTGPVFTETGVRLVQNQLPTTGFLRLPQILGNPHAEPPIPPLIPVGKSTWWAGVQAGIFPKAVKLSANITAWRAEDIKQLIDRLGQGHDSLTGQ